MTSPTTVATRFSPTPSESSTSSEKYLSPEQVKQYAAEFFEEATKKANEEAKQFEASVLTEFKTKATPEGEQDSLINRKLQKTTSPNFFSPIKLKEFIERQRETQGLALPDFE